MNDYNYFMYSLILEKDSFDYNTNNSLFFMFSIHFVNLF